MRCIKCKGVKEQQKEFNKLCYSCKKDWEFKTRNIILDQSFYKIENINRYEKAADYLKTIMN